MLSGGGGWGMGLHSRRLLMKITTRMLTTVNSRLQGHGTRLGFESDIGTNTHGAR